MNTIQHEASKDQSQGGSRAYLSRMSHFRCCYRWSGAHRHHISPPFPLRRRAAEERRERPPLAIPPSPTPATGRRRRRISSAKGREEGPFARERRGGESGSLVEFGPLAEIIVQVLWPGELPRWAEQSCTAQKSPQILCGLVHARSSRYNTNKRKI